MSEFEIRLWGNNDLTVENFPLTWEYIQKAFQIHGQQLVDDDNNKMFDKDYNL